jgi:regulator of replication initiation timing
VAREEAEGRARETMGEVEGLRERLRRVTAECEAVKRDRAREALEDGERREKEVGEVLADIRTLKAHNNRLQMENEGLAAQL